MSQSEAVENSQDHKHSHASWTGFLVVFAVLMILLIATVILDQFDFGRANLWLALSISVAKAVLIAIFFMQLRVASGTIRIVAIASTLWLGVAITLTIADYATRGFNQPESAGLQQSSHPRTYDRVSDL